MLSSSGSYSYAFIHSHWPEPSSMATMSGKGGRDMQTLCWMVTCQLKMSSFKRTEKSKHWRDNRQSVAQVPEVPHPQPAGLLPGQGLGSPLLPRSLALSSVQWPVGGRELCCGYREGELRETTGGLACSHHPIPVYHGHCEPS